MPALWLFLLLVLSVPMGAQSESHGPDCSASKSWPTMMTLTHLKNAGLLDPKQIDPSKTTTVRLASERTGKNLWHQVYHVSFTTKSGEAVDAIAVHDASSEECSMSGVDVFVISKHLGPK